MSKFVKKRSAKSGLPPGSLIHIGELKPEKIKISMIDYDAENLYEVNDILPEECVQFLDKPTVTWIQVCGIYDPKMIESIGKHFNLHPLILEDILNTSQRPKLDDYKENIFIVMRKLKYTNGDHKELHDEQISIVFGRNYVISFVEHDDAYFNSVQERIRKNNSRIRMSGTDYLVYALIDTIVDNYFGVLEKIDEDLDILETEVVEKPSTRTLQKIQNSKRLMALLRKNIWPSREMISQFLRLETPLIQPTTTFYVHDVYDHTIQANDTVEGFRDIVGGMLDIYLSNMNQRMNEIMKLLTVVATIFVPLTFITSWYGMNLKMPEVQFSWTYPILIVFMFFCLLGMLLFFRRKKWL